MTTSGPWDPGLQNERTGLAWQRTLLSGLSCTLLVGRLLASFSLVLALSVGVLALLCTVGLGAVAVQRFRHRHVALHEGGGLGDGRPHLFLTALVVVTALGALLYVVVV